jgi:thioredoxin-like negative regulator of GroEL
MRLLPPPLTAPALLALGLLTACTKPAETPAPPAATAAAVPAAKPAAAEGVAWRYASSDADVDAAFERARADGKPVFVYWGAKWCPPCNQVMATVFNRQDFIERSRAFVPVYVDGDRPGAQKLGARFKVRGYPTMVLFDKDGNELTRLPGEVDAEQYTRLVTLGMNAQRPIKAVLDAAIAGSKDLRADDWRLLAFYSWDTDEQRLVPRDSLPQLLQQLARLCPPENADAAMRLTLKALALGGEQPQPDAAAREVVTKLLTDPAGARTHMDVLANNAPELVRALAAPETPERAQLVQAFDAAMRRFEADASLSRADRIGASIARVALAKIDASPDNKTPKLAESLLTDVRGAVAKIDRETTDPYERQAVVTASAYLLAQAGLVDDSDALLNANLARSHSPYYLMSALASNARKRGDNDAALRWYEEAYIKSEGPATRLQWGVAYLDALIELAPGDSARIERAASQILAEAGAMPDAFHERAGRSMQRLGRKLLAWGQSDARAPVFKRLKGQLDTLCAKLPIDDPQRASCQAVLKPGSAAA